MLIQVQISLDSSDCVETSSDKYKDQEQFEDINYRNQGMAILEVEIVTGTLLYLRL